MTIKSLRGEARKAAKSRGHKLVRFQALHSTSAYSECRACLAYVFVNLQPRPNETYITGNAVALNCLFS